MSKEMTRAAYGRVHTYTQRGGLVCVIATSHNRKRSRCFCSTFKCSVYRALLCVPSTAPDVPMIAQLQSTSNFRGASHAAQYYDDHKNYPRWNTIHSPAINFQDTCPDSLNYPIKMDNYSNFRATYQPVLSQNGDDQFLPNERPSNLYISPTLNKNQPTTGLIVTWILKLQLPRVIFQLQNFILIDFFYKYLRKYVCTS